MPEPPRPSAADIFCDALNVSPDERAGFIRECCAGDAALLAEVRSLLAAHGEAGSFLRTPATQLELPELAEAAIGQRIGPYRISARVGSGGMGSVYRAVRDDDHYHKEVAVKLVKRGMDTDDILRRFRAERQVLANLEHPNIARLIDGGATDAGLPYLVMEFVDGLPIDHYCVERRLAVDQRLMLFEKVCSAVHYAHQNLIVHRDLKPSNIVVTINGMPKLLDFGIAKVLSPEGDAPAHTVTEPGQRFITPAYASPEQIRGERVTTASDVYALGVVLYELLTGHRPYLTDSRSVHEIERLICLDEPTKPSTAVTRGPAPDAHGSQSVGSMPQKRLARKLAGDLDNIVLMALRKEPQRRYGSVEQFAEDLRRHREGLPVVARRDTIRYRGAKFVKRNRLAVGAAAAVTLALVAGFITSAVLYTQADRAKRAAERVSRLLQDTLASVNPEIARGRDVTVLRGLLDDCAQRIDTELADQPDVAAALHLTIGNTYLSIALYGEAERHTRAALALRQATSGRDHADVATCLDQLGNLLRIKGDYAASESAFRRSCEIWQSRTGRRHAKVAAAHVNLGRVVEAIGRADEAEEHYRTALSINRETLDANHSDLASNLIHLGLQLMHRKSNTSYDSAEPLLREALRIRRNADEENHPSLARAQMALAGLLRERRRFEDAEPLYREALALRKKVLDANHPDIAAALNDLATLLEFRGDYTAAEPMYRETLAIQESSLGDRHPEVGTTLNNLAGLLRKSGRYDDAEPLFLQAADIYRGSLGPRHFWVSIVLQNLGVLLETKGDCAAALPIFEEALHIRKESVAADNWRIAQIEALLGGCLTALGRYDEAEPLLLASFPRIERARGADDPITRDARRRLVDYYTATDQPTLAAKYQNHLPDSDSEK